jgi:hypothetical protein
MAVPSAVAAFVRKNLPAAVWTAVLGRLTFVFGVGQCLGPVLSGVLSDTSSLGIRAGLIVSTALLLAGALVALFQAEPAQRSYSTRMTTNQG